MRKFLAAAAIAATGLTAAFPAGANCTGQDFDGHFIGVGEVVGRDNFHQALYCELNIRNRSNFLEFGGGSVCSVLPDQHVSHRAFLFSSQVRSDCTLLHTSFMRLLGTDEIIDFQRATGSKTHSDRVDNIVIAGYYRNRLGTDFTMTLNRAR